MKICGLTNRDDAMFALEYGADYIGFVLYEGSPRGITGNRLFHMLGGIDVDRKAVGVFVNETREEVIKIAGDCGLYAVQLHGDEVADDFPGMPIEVWRALRVDGDICVPEIQEWPAGRYVIDAHVPGIYGGTGTLADWDRSAELACEYSVMLSGGLTPDNVAEAVKKVCPAGVDTSSGVEAGPGRKDRNKVRDFIRTAKRNM